jgi:hypothetical protein
MTKKNYIAAAKKVSSALIFKEQRILLATFLSEFFQEENPQFDPIRFKKACGVE